MIGGRSKYLVLAILLAASLFPVFSSSAQEGTPAGSILHIQGYGLYKDDDGREHLTVSEIVTIVIQTVTLLSVTPNETEPSAQVRPYQEFTRLFQICNGGNNSDQVMVSKLVIAAPARVVRLYFDSDGNGMLSAADQEITVGQSLSPSIMPGG